MLTVIASVEVVAFFFDLAVGPRRFTFLTGSAWTLDVVVAVRRSRMRPLLGLGPLRLATRAACLMSAAAPRPIVTQDRAPGGMITIAPGEGVEYTQPLLVQFTALVTRTWAGHSRRR